MIENIKLIDRSNSLRYMGVKGTPSLEIVRIVEERERELCSVLTPRYLYKVFETGEGSFVLSGNDVIRHLENCDKFIVFAATLGSAVDSLIRKYQATDVTSALAVDAEASAAAEMLCDIATDEIAKALGKSLTTRYSPGYGDYPLEKQKEILAALDAERKIGLFAGESYMLAPTKSVTAIIGIKNASECEGWSRADRKCRSCGFYDKCSVRKEDDTRETL